MGSIMPDRIISGNSRVCCTPQKIHSLFCETSASEYDRAPSPTPKIPRMMNPKRTCSGYRTRPKGMHTTEIRRPCTTSGAHSFSARPIISDERDSGVARIRS
jgi:hypothetical protein